MESARSTAGLLSSWAQVTAEAFPQTAGGQEDDDTPGNFSAAAHSRIRGLEQGMLLVEADHPGWIQMLKTRQDALLVSVKRRFPELGIKGISFRLSREPFR